MHSDIKLTNFRKISVFNHKFHDFPPALDIFGYEIDFNNEFRPLGLLCYNLLTGDITINESTNKENYTLLELLFSKLEDDEERKTNEYKISINILFETVSFLIFMIKYYFYKGVKAV